MVFSFRIPDKFFILLFVSSVEEVNANQRSIVREHSSTVTSSVNCRTLIVQRSRNIFHPALQQWSRPHFAGHTSLIKVKFISDLGMLEEDAMDLGGPRREFLRMLKSSIIQHSKVLTGDAKTYGSVR